MDGALLVDFLIACYVSQLLQLILIAELESDNLKISVEVSIQADDPERICLGAKATMTPN